MSHYDDVSDPDPIREAALDRAHEVARLRKRLNKLLAVKPKSIRILEEIIEIMANLGTF